MFIVKIKKLTEDCTIPQKAHIDDAAFDIYAAENIIVEPQKPTPVSTGFCMELPPQEAVAAMLTGAEDALRQSGYEPYYLYRQKYMSGSFENTGWCRPGYTGLYNIYMMEELHTILSLGGGGMNKINLPEEKLARYHNPKIPQDYISRIDTILQQKDEIFSILRGLREQNP